MKFLSRRMAQIKPSPTLAITARAAQLKALGNNIISLGAGEPDFDTPEFIKEACIKALGEGKTKYTAVEGTLSLRKAIVEKFKTENTLEYSPEEILVGVGAKQIIFNAFLATLNPGDEVVIPAPYWVSYPDMVEIAEGTPVFVRCLPENELKLTPKELKDALTPQTKWLILNSPNNPSGMVYTRKELEKLAQVVRGTPNLHVLSDDIYEHILYDKVKFHTFAEVAPDLKDRTLTVNGLSKAYAMTGWRVGYGAGSRNLIEAMTVLQSQSTSNATSFVQDASVTALSSPKGFLKAWKKTYTERRDKASEILGQVPGLSCLKPHGAFYLFVSCAPLMGKTTPLGTQIASDSDFATYLLESAGVAVVPGAAFGLSPYFRISFALDDKKLVEACKRISQAVGLLK